MHVDGAVKRIQLAAAHRFHDLVACQHPAGPLGQRHQQIELVGGQFAVLRVHHHGARIPVDFQRAKAHLLGRRRAAVGAPAQHCAHAGQQLARLKRLGQVVVGTHLQADDAVHRVALGCEHQHRYLGAAACERTDAPAHLQAIHVRQHQIQNDELGWPA